MRRKWTTVKDGGADDNKWTLVSYNILSPSLCSAHAELYGRNKYTGWKERKSRLLRELESYGASIYALQECNAEIVESLRGKSKGVVWASREDDRGDGCAVAYDRNRFRLVESEQVRLEADAARYESCAIAVLDEHEGNLTLVVASVHLIYNPKRGDLRLRQIDSVARRVSKLSQTHRAARRRDVAHIVCGDFNSTPSSAVYAFMAKGCVDAEHLDRRTTTNEVNRYDDRRGHAGTGTSLLTLLHQDDSHALKQLVNPLTCLKSAYAEPHPALPQDCPGEPGFTTYLERGAKACVDYIFYDSDSLSLHGRYEMIPHHIIERTSGIPSPEAPSDHIALVVQFFSTIQSTLLPLRERDEEGDQNTQNLPQRRREDANQISEATEPSLVR